MKFMQIILCMLLVTTSAQALSDDGHIVVRTALTFAMVASEYRPHSRVYLQARKCFFQYASMFLSRELDQLKALKDHLRTFSVNEQVYTILDEIARVVLQEKELVRSIDVMRISPPSTVPDIETASSSSGGSFQRMETSPITIGHHSPEVPRKRVTFSLPKEEA